VLLLLTGCFWVTSAERESRWDLDGDGVARPADCNDGDPSQQAQTWYLDMDGDGFGDPASQTGDCDPGEGFVIDNTDCDDADDAIFPGADEVCNGADDDCDGTADNGAEVPTWYADADGDGFGDEAVPVSACEQPPGAVANTDDCDDTTAAVSPEGTEVCNTIDDDCDGDVDLDDTDLNPADHTWYFDGDGDGYGVDSLTEVSCTQPGGFEAIGGDCDDLLFDVNPGRLADDCATFGVDDNCDGALDPYGSDNATLWFADLDNDGWGDPLDTALACADLGNYGWVDNGLDCDDGDDCSHLGAVEYCNGFDNDCNNMVDDACTPPVVDTANPGSCG
jgi:hypothetical protein